MYSFIGLSVKIESIFFSFFFDSDLSKSDSTFHIWINPTKTIVQICQIFISTILISSLRDRNISSLTKIQISPLTFQRFFEYPFEANSISISSLTRIIYSSSSALLQKKAQSLSLIVRSEKMWNVPKIVSQLFEPATFRGKVEIGLSSGWNFPQRSTKEWRNAGGGGENQRLTSSAWHWLKFVFRQRIKIVPTLPSRRGRYSITHVACQLSNKGQTREKKKERKKERKKRKK